MKKITKFFIWASIFDIITTIFGLRLGCVEMNIVVNRYGWTIGLIVKFLGTMFIIYVLEKYEKHWVFWIPAGFMWLIVVWNILNIIVKMI